MRPTHDITAHITSSEFLAELHNFLWIEPLMNRGRFDAGWNCRDHAWVVSCILGAHGVSSQLVLGKAMFVQGAAGDAPSAGLGVPPEDSVGTHTWLEVAGLGLLDLSPNLNISTRPWRRSRLDGVVGGELRPREAGEVRVCRTPAEYRNAVNLATHVQGGLCAIYLPTGAAALTRDDITNSRRFVYSPLTEQVCRRFGDDALPKLVLHLLDRRGGKRRSLAGVSQNKAWSIVTSEIGASAAVTVADTCLPSVTVQS